MKYSIKDKTKEVVTTTKRVITNSERFVQGTALLVTSGYNYYDLTIRPVAEVEFYIRAAATVVIALRGAYELIRFLDKD
jgi:hypothetical protein